MADGERIATEQILDWLEGRLAPDQAASVEQALAERGDQAGEVAWLRAFLAASVSVKLERPGEQLHAALLAQFRPSPLARAVRSIAAALTFDSALRPALAGMRSAGAEARQVIFSCELAEVALSVRPSRQGDLLDLGGQLFPSADAAVGGLAVQIAQAGELVDATLTNEVGEFLFDALAPGEYALTLTIGGAQVAIAPLTLQADGG